MKNKRTTWSLKITLCLFTLLTLVSCMGDYEMPKPEITDGNSMLIALNVPQISNPTRAMGGDFEQAINPKQVRFLVFKQVGTSAKEEYAYSATVSSVTPSGGGVVLYKVKLLQDAAESPKSRVVILANTAVSSPTVGEDKAEFLSKLKFAATEKWANDKHIPMWGETALFNVAGESIPQQQASLLRSLARIDVGLNFSTESNEEALGLKLIKPGDPVDKPTGPKYFQLATVRVYRTYKEGFVAPAATNYTLNASTGKAKATAPTVSGITDKFADNDATLRYDFSDVPTDAYVREIYVPETDLTAAANLADRACIVIGGYYGVENVTNKTKITYYRVDFTKDDNGVIANIPLLRNHRYRVDVKEITNPGFDTEDEALKALSSSIKSQVLAWDEQSLDMYVSGNYHFGVSARKLKFGSAPGKGATPGSKQYEEGHKEITFESNIEPGYWKNIIVHHTDEEGNDAPIMLGTSTLPWTIPATNVEVYELSDAGIKFRTNADNSTALIERTITLEIPHTKIKFNVELTQEVFRPIFNISCSPEVFGIARKEKSLTDENYVEFTATLGDGAVALNPFDVHLETETVNGMKFSGSGTFTPGQTTTKIKMQGSGTPTAIMPTHFLVKSTATQQPFECEFVVRVSLHAKRILCINDVAPLNDYNFGSPDKIGYKIINNKYNYGSTEAQATVPIDHIYIDVIPVALMPGATLAARLGPNGPDDYDSEGKLIGEKCDILLTTYALSLTEEQAKVIEAFVRRGGALIYQQQQNEPTADLDPETQYVGNYRFFSRLFADGGDRPHGKLNNWGNNYERLKILGEWGATLDGEVYAAVNGSQPHLIFPRSILKNESDQIVNGPFGDVRGKYWGQDFGHTSAFKLTEDQKKKVHIYGNVQGTTIGLDDKYKELYPMFRMKNFNVFFVGDGGFTSQPLLGAWTSTSETAYPFHGKEDPRNPGYGLPAPSTPYGASGVAEGLRIVYNSIIFCNVLTWACEAVEYKWNRYDSSGERQPGNTEGMINWEGVVSPIGAPLY